MKKTRDELAKQLVDREVLICQSGLVDTILKYGFESRWIADELFTIDDIENYYQRYDIDDLISDNPDTYEEFILDNADLLTETYSDEYDEWRKQHPDVDEEDVEQFLDWLEEFAPFGDEEGEIRMTRRELLENIPLDEDDIDTLYDYFERNSVEIEDPYAEIYEWWVVTDWFAEKLKAKGEAILDQWGGPWWGRRTTGQAIYMDSVIQEIAWGLWGDVKEAADGSESD